MRITLLVCCLSLLALGALAQSAYVDPVTLVKSSPVIVLAEVTDLALVVHPPTSKEHPHTPGDLSTKHVVGFLYRLRLEEIVRKDRKLRKGDWINVFVSYNSFTGGPTLVKGQRYLVLLGTLNPNKDEFAGTVIRERGKSTPTPFEPSGMFVFRGEASAVLVSPKNANIVDSVRKAAAGNP